MHDYCESLRSCADVTIGGDTLQVLTGAYASARCCISVYFGPLSMGCTPEEAIALGAALIEAAHHWRAALAEYQQHLAGLGTAGEGGAA